MYFDGNNEMYSFTVEFRNLSRFLYLLFWPEICPQTVSPEFLSICEYNSWKNCMLPTFLKWTFYKGLYGENDGPSIWGQRREKHVFKLKSDESLCWMLSKSIKKIIPYLPFDRAMDETLKILEMCWPFLYLNFTRVLQSSSTSPRL